jgi:hypothetical protein
LVHFSGKVTSVNCICRLITRIGFILGGMCNARRLEALIYTLKLAVRLVLHGVVAHHR